MHKKLLILCLLLTGCSATRTFNVTVTGKNIKSVWASGEDVNISIFKKLVFYMFTKPCSCVDEQK